MNSTETNLDLLASRVQKLEASNRRWKLVNSLLVLLAVSVALMGAKPADRMAPPMVRASTVEAQEFILKDLDDHVYARLSLGRALTTKQRNGLYFMPNNGLYSGPSKAVPALQFFNDQGDVVWTAPTKAEFLPAK